MTGASLYTHRSHSPWAQVFKTDLARAFEFPAKLSEDMPHTFDVCAGAQMVVETPEPFYAYLVRPSSDGRFCGSGNHLPNDIRRFDKDILPRMNKYKTLLKIPHAHSVNPPAGYADTVTAMEVFALLQRWP